MADFIAEARVLLARVRAADPTLRELGASVHRYELAPPLSDADLRVWEDDHGIELPSDYRAFLTELGSGGAGPGYGILPLQETDIVGDIRAAFPHVRSWNLPSSRLEPPETFESDDAEDAWNAALDAELYEPSLLDGAFWICEHGCALRTLLVVTGPERGNVWFDGRADNNGIRPHRDADGRHSSFADWYMAWLDECLR